MAEETHLLKEIKEGIVSISYYNDLLVYVEEVWTRLKSGDVLMWHQEDTDFTHSKGNLSS